MEELKLIIPTEEYKEQVMNYKKVFLETGEEFHGCSGLNECETYEEWLDFEKRLLAKYKEEYSPSTEYLAIRKSDNKLIGMITLRYNLTDFLYKYCGNIGYSVIPSERKKGYATKMLKMILKYAKEKGMHRVLIIADKENIASCKTIIANGGILENEIIDDVNLSKSGTIQRYWISLKKRFANRLKDNNSIVKSKQKIINVKSKEFTGDVYAVNMLEVKEKVVINNKTLCIQDSNYKWLMFYDYSSQVCLTSIYNQKNEIVEWYFDIARCIGKENGIPYEDDFYLDVVLRPNGETILLDEDEFEEAYQKRLMTKEEYDEAYKVTRHLIERVNGKHKEVKKFTDKYLNEIL